MTVATPTASRPRGALGRVYAVILRHLLTWGRAAVVLSLGALTVLIALAIRAGADDPTTSGTELINGAGLTAIVPVSALLFASSAFGDMADDRTLVYLWMTPTARWRMAVAATLASITVTLPLTFVPLVLTAAATGAGTALVGATAVATTVGTIGYCGVFVAVGLRFRRALVWGIAYILIWEGFVASASDTAARLSLRGYTASILSQYTGVGLRLGSLTLASGILVPIAVAVAATALTGWLLRRTDVD